jgi:DNA mismatch repair protein MutS
LEQLPELKTQLTGHASPLAARWRALDPADDLRDLLGRALVDEPPLVANEGGIFKQGYAADLDALMDVSDDGHAFLDELEKRERQRTGIANLKVRFNRVFGYYIEITKANLHGVPKDYIRKQTLVGAERFITDELKTYEDKVLGAEARRFAREAELYAELVAVVGAATPRLRAISRLIAETDVYLSLAEVADEGRYVRPEVSEAGVLELVQSRHPVVERLLPGGERFVPNDVVLDVSERQLLVVTGPNMAGKSTVMRQVALGVLLAHMGSFVPAKRAKVGLVDRIFTRVGASDNLGRGQSTFMVEMIETATILREATAKSLVVLDEIGRGTSTFDGVSIAWAVAEHLHDEVGCRAMFATHYHELVDLALERPRIKNVSVAVKEHNERIVFLRQLVDGAANRSYGIQVARLAGLPEGVLGRAREILANLERCELDEQGMPALAASSQRRPGGQLGLFARPLPTPPPAHPVLAEILALEPDRMTPIEALVALGQLRARVASSTE